jgi:Uma2 family endonuclease
MSAIAKRGNSDQFRQIPVDGVTRELVSGEIVERAAPSAAHDDLVERLHALLTRYCDDAGICAVFRFPWPLELSNLDVVRPDCYVMAFSVGAFGVDGVRGTPELVVEVLSPDSRERDLGEKLRLYAWAGVREYWVVDPERKFFVGKTKGRQGYDDLPADPARFTSALFPGLTIDFATLFG